MGDHSEIIFNLSKLLIVPNCGYVCGYYRVRDNRPGNIENRQGRITEARPHIFVYLLYTRTVVEVCVHVRVHAKAQTIICVVGVRVKYFSTSRETTTKCKRRNLMIENRRNIGRAVYRPVKSKSSRTRPT